MPTISPWSAATHTRSPSSSSSRCCASHSRASLYNIAPNHRSPWKYELPGALLASVWWTVVSLGFGTYLGLASSGANAIFGFLGGALSLLFWLYLMAMGLLLGAEVNSIIATRRGVILEAVPRERLDRWLKRALRR